jgi:eukaryotic-like serine/threonine-protein kinase
MAKTHRLMLGSTFAGRFRIESILGEGAMGTVYLAVEGDRRCALKVLKASVESSPKARERFAREAMVGAQIGSPHVVEVSATGFDDVTELHWLAMEHLEGASLADWLHDRVGPEARESVLRQIFEAMAAAHAAGVIHRDLKPENIMVLGSVEAPDVKILDFGVAKTFRPSLGASSTEGGLGTPLWAAPEQGHGGFLEPSVDLWSLGLLAFYVLTGKVYWWHYNQRDSGMLDLAMEMLQEPIAPASERAAALGVAEAIPPGFDTWFARTVCREKAERFVDAVQGRDALLALLDHGDVGPSTRPPALSRPASRPPPSIAPASASAPAPSVPTWVWAVVAVAVLAALFVALR